MPSLADAYARLRGLTAEIAQVQATIDRLTLDPDVFDHYEEHDGFGDREDYVISKANLPYVEGACPTAELDACFNAYRWRVDDNLNGETHSGDADNFADARRQVILAMADYMMKKEKA